MNYKMLTKMSIRLIALYYFVKYFVFTITSVISIVEVLRQPGEYTGMGLLSAVTPMILMIIMSILLWTFAGKIADRLIGPISAEGIMQNMDYNKIQYIAFCVAGILIICNSIPHLFSSIYQIVSIPDPQLSIPERIYNGYLATFIGAVIQTILGLWLVIGTKGIINMIKKLRTAGLDGEPQQEEQINKS